LVLTGSALAQAQLGAGQVWGNSGASRAPAQSSTLTSIIDRALGSTRGAILERGASGWQIVAPSATVGLPWVSAGTGADPLYQLLGVVGGGTGLNVYAVGDIICATGTTTLSRIADVATGQVLRSGGVGACPAWGAGAALTKTDDTNVTATLGGTPANALVNAASITLGWTGTLAVARGGSGSGTQQGLQNAAHNCPPTRAGDLIYYNGTNWVCLAGNNTGTRILQEDASGVPSWVAAGTGTVTNVATGGLATGGPITTTGTVTVTASTAADQETATSTTTAVTPSVQQRHPSASKAFVSVSTCSGSPCTILSAYNVTSVTRSGTGTYAVNLTTSFSSASYVCTIALAVAGGAARVDTATKAAGVVPVIGLSTAFALQDIAFDLACFGDQ
jgi:hypothetical protein